MSSPTTAPSPNLAPSRGSGIEYKAYTRRFQPNVDASVLILMATCYYDMSGFSILFQPTDSGFELVEQPPSRCREKVSAETSLGSKSAYADCSGKIVQAIVRMKRLVPATDKH
jgi:hypothetical protein